jgi:streptomycin 6-kinase
MSVLARCRKRADCVQLIDSDEEIGAVLMERVLPGTVFRMLAHSQSEHGASSQVRHLFEKTPLRTEAGDDLPSYSDWCSRAFADYRHHHGSDAFLVHIGHVESILAATADRYESGWLLHGDLHHENILLRDARDYVVIDPKGVIGPRLFEYGRFVHNFFVDRLHSMSAESILTQRIAALRGEYSEDEILMVGYVDLVLSSCWSLNSGQKLKTETLELMGLMSALLE